MPSLPVYNSQRNITQTQSQPMRNEASQKAQDRDIVIGSIQKATQQWSDAHDVMQYTEAKGKYEIGAADIQARAALDPNFKDSAKYYKELEDVKKNSLVGISNKQIMEKLSMDMDFSNQMAAIKIDTQFKVKELETNKFNLSQSIEGLQQKKLQASTSAEAAQYDQEMADLLALNVSTGTITAAEAEKMKDTANEASAEFDAVVYPDKFMDNGSKYYGIGEDKYRSLKEKAMNAKERSEKEMLQKVEETQQTNEANLIMALADKQIDRLSVPEITKQMRNGNISREFGEAYLRVLTSPKSIDNKKGSKGKVKESGFTDYAKSLFQAEDPKETKEAIIRMLDGAADGDLSEEELAVVLKVADKASKKTGWIGGAVDSLAKLAEGTNFSEQKMVFSMLKYISGGMDPEAAKKEAITEQQVKHNPNRTKYSVGDMVETPMGPMYVWGYYPDGEPDVRKEKPKQ